MEVKDEHDANPTVYVNGEKQSSYYNQSSKQMKLEEGSNEIVVEARNAAGKTTKVIKTVVFNSGGPVLHVENIPATTNKDTIVVRWTVTDPNDRNPVVSVNNNVVYNNKATVSLKPGVNTIQIKVTNKQGDTTTETLTTVFEPAAPTLTLGYAPETTTSQYVTLTWYVDDINDNYPKVYINDRIVSSDRTNVELVPGNNTFKFVASNKFDKITELIYNVIYDDDKAI